MELPRSLLKEDLGRWYGLSYDGSRQKPVLRVHALFENHERLVNWSHVNRKGLYYEGDLLCSAVTSRALSIVHGDRYARFEFSLEKAYPPHQLQHDLAALFALVNSARELEHKQFAHDPDRPQLMQLAAGESPHPFVSGILSPRMVRWLATKRSSDLRPVKQAMFEARNAYAERPSEYNEDSPNPFHPIEVWFNRHGWISLDCAGGSCLVQEERFAHGRGYTLTSLNIDQSYVQISILAGLAKLHELAAAELDGGPPDD